MRKVFVALAIVLFATPAWALSGRIGLPPQPVIGTHDFLTNGGFTNGTTGWTLGSCWSATPTTGGHNGTDMLTSTTGVCQLDVNVSSLNLGGLQPLNASQQVEVVFTGWVDITSATNGTVQLYGATNNMVGNPGAVAYKQLGALEPNNTAEYATADSFAAGVWICASTTPGTYTPDANNDFFVTASGWTGSYVP